MNIIRLRDELGLSWNEIARRLGVHKEAARAKYRRMKGTHEKKEKQLLGVEYAEQGNDAVASVQDEVVHSLEQLLEICQVDRDVWEVERYLVNSWGQHSVDEGYVTLYQVKAWLKRRVPIATEWPVVQPVKMDCQYRKSEGVVDGLGTALIIPDSQTGFWRDFEHGRLYP